MAGRTHSDHRIPHPQNERPASLPLLALSQIRYSGIFPKAAVRYLGLPGIRLRLTAFSALSLPDDSEGFRFSSLPLALFRFDIENTGMRSLPATLMVS